MIHRALFLSLLFAVEGAACTVESPPRGPEQTCAAACGTRAPRCTRHECARGCNLVLDRLVEREGDHVVECVAHSREPCEDPLWAHCATRIGPYADGGPAPPPPHRDDFDEEP
ncbi:MAG: hypothetical protein ABSC94_10920 [Polyangiaceae bacterium]